MTKEQLVIRAAKNKIELTVARVNELLYDMTPYKSGKMAGNWYFMVGENGLEFKNDTDYFKYTTGEWTSPRWNGRANPNQGWDEEAFRYIVEFLAKELGGQYVFN